MSPDLVSIIIPCFNYGKFIHSTLEHVKQQSYPHWECLVVDDGSTDCTPDVVARFAAEDSRVRYFFQDNAGPSAARNLAITHCNGQFIQFLDADDLIAPDKIRLQVAILQENPQYDLVYGEAYYFPAEQPPDLYGGRGGTSQPEHGHLKATGDGATIFRRLVVNNFIDISSPLLRRSVVDKAGLFPVGYKYYEDWLFWIRAALAGCSFLYAPTNGTETFIRYGHNSLMTHKLQLVASGIRLRQELYPLLNLPWKTYNTYRIARLWVKKQWLQRKK